MILTDLLLLDYLGSAVAVLIILGSSELSVDEFLLGSRFERINDFFYVQIRQNQGEVPSSLPQLNFINTQAFEIGKGD